MSWHTIICAGGAVFAGILLQAAVGFGMGLLAIPILLWLGIDLPVAIAALTVATFSQSLYGSIAYRQHIPWRAVWQITPTRFVFTLVGVALLWQINTLPTDRIRQIVGVAILLIITTQLLLRVKPRQHVPIGWALFAASLSGIMAGAIGMGGPPVVFWAMAHDWPSRVTRSFFWVSFGLLAPLLVIVLLWTFGSPVWHGLLLGCVCIPLTLIAARVGIGIGERLNRQRLRTATVALLAIIALMAIGGPLVSGTHTTDEAVTSSPASPSPGPNSTIDPGDSPARP